MSSTDNSLRGRSAVITGSTSGIGLACARALAAAGADILLNGWGEPGEIETLRGEIETTHGVRCLHSNADMERPEEVAGLIALCAASFGRVDILVNNAGIQHVAPVDEFPLEAWQKVLAINLTAPFAAIRAALPHMKSAGWGRIISTASAHSLVASPYKSAYVAAKHGLVGLTRTVALEVAESGITANAISPGYVWTPLVERQIPATMQARGLTREQVMRDVLLAAQPTRRFVQVEEVAALVLFLCSDAAASITGANLSMDGGWTAQ